MSTRCAALTLVALLATAGCELPASTPGTGNPLTPVTPQQGSGRVTGRLGVAPMSQSLSLERSGAAPLLAGRLPRLVPPARVSDPAPPMQRAEVVASELILRFEERKGAGEAALALEKLGYRAEHLGFASEHLHLVRVSTARGAPLEEGETVALAAELHRRVPGLTFAEPNRWRHVAAVPNDTYYSSQWDLPAMNLPQAWDVTVGSTSVVVGIIDSGIVRHPDLDARVVSGYDFITSAANADDSDGRDADPADSAGETQVANGKPAFHGSHVAGTVAASGNDGRGVAGVAWQVRLQPLRACGLQGCTDFDIISAAQWGGGLNVPGLPLNPTPASVLNLSLGGEGAPTQAAQEVIDALIARGVVLVVAAGNSGADSTRFSPCNQDRVICVAASGPSGSMTDYSNFGDAIDVLAPGGDSSVDTNADGYGDAILSTVADRQGNAVWGFKEGTSMASPHVAGLVALMKSVAPSKTFAELEAALTQSVQAGTRCAKGCGAGLVDARAALDAVSGTGTANGPRLTVSQTAVLLTSALPRGQLRISNAGTEPLTVSATSDAGDALLFPNGAGLSLARGQAGVLELEAQVQGRPDGTSSYTVTLSSNGGTVAVKVTVRLGQAAADKDATVALLTEDAAGKLTLVTRSVATFASGYAFELAVPPGAYLLAAAIDDDGDGQLFEEGERYGIYPTVSTPTAVRVSAGQQTEASFSLSATAPGTPQPSGPGIGSACAAASDCPSGGLCTTAWPGGYCTATCSSTSCPQGSTCYDLGSDVKACLQGCAAPGGGQSTCRAGYVCHPDGSGTGFCGPR